MASEVELGALVIVAVPAKPTGELILEPPVPLAVL